MARDTATDDPQAGQRSRDRQLVIRIVKCSIALLVVVALCLAGNAAWTQWKAEKTKLTGAIADLDRQLKTADPAVRNDLIKQRDQLTHSLPRWSTIRWSRCLWAAILYALGLVPSGFLLHRALKSFDQHSSLGTSVAAQLIGHMGKYVPGKAMVIVIRAGVLSRDGVRPLPATISIFLETFLMMAVGGAVAGFVVLWLPVPAWIAVMSVGVALAASVPTVPPVLRAVTQKLVKKSLPESEIEIGWGLVVAGWAWSTLSWLLIGAAFTMLVTAIPAAEPLPPLYELYLVATAAISLAIVIGFASLLPGGAGVRELVVTTVLGVALGPVHGILSAIAARILFMIVEASLAAGSWGWLRVRRSRSTA